ncbi:AI-2E family transporter [Mumia sp.]|uniref:AI-2E family transporter n=1 Tax=Mumia sp. TaxID=1965300 RepID=UPI00260AE5F2|nr:AI-2E family transporter [Mumia sp.]MDD9349077.1 AI-2E family transporter [Mumia sp.]
MTPGRKDGLPPDGDDGAVGDGRGADGNGETVAADASLSDGPSVAISSSPSRRDRLDELVERMRATARRDLAARDDRAGVLGDPVPTSSPYAALPPATPADATPPNVPYGIALAASWGWRLIIIAAAGLGLMWLLGFFSEITIPVAIAILVTALIRPFVDRFERLHVPRALATLLVMVLGIGAVVGMLTLVGQQVSAQFDDLRTKVVDGLEEIQDWARTGPLGLSDAQLNAGIDRVTGTIEAWGSSGTGVVDRVTELGTTVTHLLAGFFIVLFATYFFLYQGGRIWDWVVRIFPRNARSPVDTSGRVAWASLTAFVRATVLVALVDAIGIAGVAWGLGVPLVLAIATLVFLGAFVPIVGAFVSGLVAVLVALVAQGPWTAIFMLLGVIAVQQVEAHILQPFLMGHLVQLHPLAIILAIAAGVTVAGIVGALLAVPLAACVNAVVRHLSERGDPARVAPASGSPPLVAE